MTIIEINKTDKQKLCLEILAAAEIIFIRDGYNATTMETIAEKAEISKVTLYLHFKNKEQLFSSILEDKIDIYVNKLEPDLSSAISLNDLVDRIVNHQLNFLSENQYFFRLALSEQCKINREATSILQKIYIDKYPKYYTIIENSLMRFIPITAEYSAKTLALSVIGTTNSYMTHWLLTNQEQNLSELKRGIVSIYFHGVNF